MIGQYFVAFYTPQGRLVAAHGLTGADQMAYSNKLGELGTFMMSLPRSLKSPVMEQKDAIVRVFRFHPVQRAFIEDGVYLLDTRDNVPGAYQGLVISGIQIDQLLARRIYNPDDDPLVANGFSTKGGPVCSFMREVVDEQCISPTSVAERQIPGLGLGTIGLPDVSTPYYFRTEWKKQTVLDVLNDARKATGVDFWLRLTSINDGASSPSFSFEVGRRGVDRSKHSYPNGPYTYFSQSVGNLIDPQFTVDRRNEKNVVFILGKGANGNRLVYRKASPAISDSPYNYIEDIVESNDADTLDELYSAADTALAESKGIQIFSFSPHVSARGARYKVDWDLGYIVTVQDLIGTEHHVQITGVEITLVSGSETIVATTEEYSWPIL